ncbi:hypothetical protein PVAP13_4NG296600 [Panicum virgatum]|uniref:Uncharacterized protein n=1 Tax=Panicum virgatum TaxID=38727 RepID=A0A8T0T8Z5_PANVG|nr:hypothetical protein PVAP13_4NG296600 [Panicum virgatum]KAG2607902.1 hypothetical protein PVAP13_4NG296600 [Panicum virgatum]
MKPCDKKSARASRRTIGGERLEHPIIFTNEAVRSHAGSLCARTGARSCLAKQLGPAVGVHSNKKTENLLDDQESLTPNKGSDEECTRACNKLLNRYVYRQGIYTFITPENEAI